MKKPKSFKVGYEYLFFWPRHNLYVVVQKTSNTKIKEVFSENICILLEVNKPITFSKLRSLKNNEYIFIDELGKIQK